jgi:hypothetical protein
MFMLAVNRTAGFEAHWTIKPALDARIRHFAGFPVAGSWNARFSHG